VEKARQYSALAGLAICGLLAACNAEPAPQAKGPAPIPYVGPATGNSNNTGQAGEPVWRYNGDDDHLLARGVDNSNVIDVVFRCGGNVPGITFSMFGPGPPPETVRLTSGAAVRDYPVRPSPPDFAFSTDWSLGADAIAKDAVVGGFLESGKLTRGEGAAAKVWDAKTAKDKEAIDAFSKACKGRL
jgi:hypothetical protein